MFFDFLLSIIVLKLSNGHCQSVSNAIKHDSKGKKLLTTVLDNYYEYRNTNRKLCCLKIENWYLQTCEKNLMLYFWCLNDAITILHVEIVSSDEPNIRVVTQKVFTTVKSINILYKNE